MPGLCLRASVAHLLLFPAAISRGVLVDSDDAASLLREKLKLPEWVGSISAWELDGSDTIVIRVEQRYARMLQNVPRTFEGYPVMIQIQPATVAH